MSGDEFSYRLLRQLTHEPNSTQRTLAQRFGVSVGKVNYCLKALIQRGWVKAGNFRRHDNKLAYCYLLTPSGAAAKIRLTKAFLAHKEAEYEALQREIESLREELPPPSQLPDNS